MRLTSIFWEALQAHTHPETMQHTLRLILQAFPLALAACAMTPSSSPAPEATEVPSAPPAPPRDEALRGELFGAVAALEGRWQLAGPGEASIIEFRTTAAGSAVCEVMFPGSESEMVNMYTLEGNSLVMTHYCAAGNQPRMRASQLLDGRLEFTSIAVSDLASPDEVYMADMTLVILDEDHIEQHWRAVQGGEVDHMPVFELERVR